LLKGLVPLCLQQLPWLLEAHSPKQVDPRVSTALCAPDNSSPMAWLPHGYPQFATQCQEPAVTHTSEPKAPCFAILLVPGGFPLYRAWRSIANHQAFLLRASATLLKSGNPAPLLSGNVSFCGSRRPVSLRHKKAQCFPLCSTTGKPPFLH
jgi:hypothetical protein